MIGTVESPRTSRKGFPRLSVIAVVNDDDLVEILGKRLIGEKERQKLLHMLVPVVGADCNRNQSSASIGAKYQSRYSKAASIPNSFMMVHNSCFGLIPSERMKA